jgi:hypothetical protein
VELDIKGGRHCTGTGVCDMEGEMRNRRHPSSSVSSRAILPLRVLPDDGTTIGARSLCELMDKLDALYPYGG